MIFLFSFRPSLYNIDWDFFHQPKHVFPRPANDRLPAIALPVPPVNRRLARIRVQHNW
jgi:hypothetical protein